MSTGLPVVASNIEGLKEVLGKPNPSVVLVNKVNSIDEWKKELLRQ
jgi:glycosyltransferase involved in cell wall biosynthesis